MLGWARMEQTQVELLLDTGESGDKRTSLRHFRKTVRSLNNTNFHSFKRETEIEMKKVFFSFVQLITASVDIKLFRP
jgi:hypothetical protein